MSENYSIPCKIELGGFTNERTFEIELTNEIRFTGEDEGKLIGTASVEYLRDKHKNPLREGEPPFGDVTDGFVICRTIKRLPNGWALVEVPSADVIHVSESCLVPM